jgi:hypothetical protein
MKQRACFIWERVWENEPDPKWVAKFWKHMKMCSCYMCGNQRKHWKEVTRQEKNAAQTMREQVEELEEER